MEITKTKNDRTESEATLETVVMQHITEWSNDCSTGWDGVWEGFDTLSKISKIPISQLKKIVKKLRGEGKLELRETYNEDGQLHGKGYFVA
jgi:hypothetical protein